MAVPEEHKLDALYFVHDFSLTTRFRVLFLCPARFGIVRTMLGLDTPRSGMRFDPSRPTKVWLCPRDGSAPLVLEAPPGFVFHHVNAWEEDRNALIVHALRSDVLPDLPVPRDIEANSVAPPKRELPLYCEYAIDLARRRVRVATLFDVPCELPMVHPSQFSTRHRFAWATATDPSKPMRVHTRLAKFDLDEHTVTTIDFAPGFAGEPVFVPRPNAVRGDDGWLLTMGYDGEEQRSVLRVVDAQTLEIVCVFALPFDIAPGFHGTWMSAP
jgi:all-trans-8'-apo-beta-carotenal 15,15'-oxygenase